MASDSPSKASTLNPDAPLFVPSPSNAMPSNAVPDDVSEWDEFFLVPASLIAMPEVLPPEWNVEDFSPEWWNLVQTSPAFREHWLREYETEAEDVYSEMQLEEMNDLNLDEPKGEEDAASGPTGSTGVDVRALIASLKSGQQNVDKLPPNQLSLAYHDKIPKISPKKDAARRIQQPR